MKIEFLQFHKPESEIWPNDNKLISPINLIKDKKESISFRYHHFAICTDFKRKEAFTREDYKSRYTINQANPFGIQWMKYDKNCKLPFVVQNISHVAFQVNDLNWALKNKKVIIEPHSPSKGILVAFIEENGAPIELLQVD